MKEFFQIILIYVFAFYSYISILFGFKKTIEVTIEKIGKLSNKYFLLVVVLLMVSSVISLVTTKPSNNSFSLFISTMSLSMSLIAFHSNTKKNTRDNIEYYIYKIDLLDKLKKKQFIDDVEYEKQVSKLKKIFDENKDSLKKKL